MLKLATHICRYMRVFCCVTQNLAIFSKFSLKMLLTPYIFCEKLKNTIINTYILILYIIYIHTYIYLSLQFK